MPYNRFLLLGSAVLVASLMVLSSCLVASEKAQPLVGTGTVSSDTAASGTGAIGTDPARSSLSPGSCSLTPEEQTHLLTSQNDPAWAEEIQNTQRIAQDAVSSGLPARDLHLPYLGTFPDQEVNGVPETGVQIASECPENDASDPAPAPSGIAYDGQSFRGSHVVNDPTLDSNSLVGTLTVRSDANFYPDSATPTLWGAQLNAVMANVTILGHRGDAFWVQNVLSYDSHNDTLSFVDDTWNFTSYSSEMEPSSLASWSPNGSDYTGTWVAFSQLYHVPPPFTAALYVNSSVNSAGDQVLWYNYTVAAHGHFYHASYDNLVFRSQVPGHPKRELRPAPFEASATTYHLVNEGYEFDAFIGADDGSNQLMLAANATEQLKYCSLSECTPSHFAYANVPAAVNFGSQTGEQTVGVAVNYEGTTAYLSAGPLILHGLWNYTGEQGIHSGETRVLNDITVSGSPVPIARQPYVFVFFRSDAFSREGFQWAPDGPAWYLMPGGYHYEVMLSDYREQSGTLTVGHASVTLTAVLRYATASGVYTPLWAFNNAQLAGISSRGEGTVSDQYVLFNNPTSDCTYCGGARNKSLSPLFFSYNDYFYKSFSGIFLSGTNAFVDVNAPPSLLVHAGGGVRFYLNIQFYETAHATLSHAKAIRGWPAQEEIGFYLTVPASQNPAPQGDVYVWNSTHDLIMSNRFVATTPFPYSVAPDELVLYGGSHNVVWGNTFSNPPGVKHGRFYAGIGLAESGDLLYNNNFGVDNPVVYLPYNFPNVADCLPQCSESNHHDLWFYNDPHDTWNVTPQPASRVSDVVNGFPLSGNVLGPGYTVRGGPQAPTQGGNFFWNYGRSPNNRSTTPYVARFYYSDWSDLYPLGCGTIQPPGGPCGTAPPIVGSYENGIRHGGDYAPIIAITHPRTSPRSLEEKPAAPAETGPLTGGPRSGPPAAPVRTELALRSAGSTTRPASRPAGSW
jgi:thermopsin